MIIPNEPISPMAKKAVTALQRAVDRVVEEHRKQGRPLAAWRDGKAMFEMPPPADCIREEPEVYCSANAQSPAQHASRKKSRTTPS